MISWNLSLFSALLYFLVAAVAGEPSCEGVEDFGPCTGDVGNFCPRDIACSCKSGQPFCRCCSREGILNTDRYLNLLQTTVDDFLDDRPILQQKGPLCPYYRGPNGNYWYLGEKCDQLWSTLDMIVICVFPGVALAFVVAVTAQLIYICKTRSRSKTVKEPVKRKSEQRTISAHQNQAFIPEEAPRSLYTEISPRGREQAEPKTRTAQWNAPEAEARKPRGLNYHPQQALAGRSSNYNDGRQQSQSNGLDEDDYRQQPHYSRFSRPTLPPADYESQPEPTIPHAQPANRPFSFGRPQVRTNSDYYDP